jgi:hypothetical protein
MLLPRIAGVRVGERGRRDSRRRSAFGGEVPERHEQGSANKCLLDKGAGRGHAPGTFTPKTKGPNAQNSTYHSA